MAANAGAADSDPVVDILFALHDKFDFMDFAGPLEVVTTALHNINDACMYLHNTIERSFVAFESNLTLDPPAATKAFEVTIAGAEPKVLSDAGVIVGSQISFKDAHERLEDFDVIVILGGNSDAILKAKAEPLDLIAKYSEIQKQDPTRE